MHPELYGEGGIQDGTVDYKIGFLLHYLEVPEPHIPEVAWLNYM